MWGHEVVVLVAVVAYTCMALDTDTDTETNKQAACLVALVHNEKVLLERVAVVATKASR